MFTSARAELPSLIKRKLLFGNPEKTEPKLSWDGKHLTYLGPVNGVMNLWVRSSDTSDDKALTHDTTESIGSYVWAADSAHLFYLRDSLGDENWHLHVIDVTTNEDKDLTPHKGVRANIIGIDAHHPLEVIVRMNLRDKRFEDAYSIDIMTGEEKLLAKNSGEVITWIVDNNFALRAAVCQSKNGGYVLKVREGTESDWKPIAEWSPDELEPVVYGFTPNNDSLYIADSRGWTCSRLVTLSTVDGASQTLASDSLYDVGEVLIHPVLHKVEAASFYQDQSWWHLLDTEMLKYFGILSVKTRGELSICNRDGSDSLWVISYRADVNTPAYYLYDSKKRIPTDLGADRPALEKYKLSNMQPVLISARDSVMLHAYLTLPEGISPDSLPMVVYVHDGPWSREEWDFSPLVQWLANRGYACLQVNYRGSSGYGKSFLNSGNREWGAKLQEDLIDAAKWVVDQGIADSSRIAILGAGYGGYSALCGAAFTPDQFKCAIDIGGPSDLVSWLQALPSALQPVKHSLYYKIGDPKKDRKMLKARSPIFSAKRIKIPVFITQGSNDPIVPQSQSEKMVAAMKNANKDVTYMLFPDEGRLFSKPENRLKFFEALEGFLAKYLGGRTEE
jgi:dipeptidyl aminopeptidase/acylaminoacyl peptidase